MFCWNSAVLLIPVFNSDYSEANRRKHQVHSNKLEAMSLYVKLEVMLINDKKEEIQVFDSTQL
jgi:hypothetical protein